MSSKEKIGLESKTREGTEKERMATNIGELLNKWREENPAYWSQDDFRDFRNPRGLPVAIENRTDMKFSRAIISFLVSKMKMKMIFEDFPKRCLNLLNQAEGMVIAGDSRGNLLTVEIKKGEDYVIFGVSNRGKISFIKSNLVFQK